MKAEAYQITTPFEPIELRITIESTEELENLRTLAGMNITIPNAIRESSYAGKNKIAEITLALQKNMRLALNTCLASQGKVI